jgi:hypothetical protein
LIGLWHGCPCLGKTTFNPVTRCLNTTLYERTRKRIDQIKSAMPCYTVIELWEHDYNEMVRTNPDFGLFVKNNKIYTAISPRDALKGGRVNAIKTYHKCKEGEVIRYVDFTSLYPHVMRIGRYPLFQPKIINENIDPNKKYFGLLKIKVLFLIIFFFNFAV